MPFLALAGPIAAAFGASAATAGTIGAIGSAAGAVGSLVQANQAKQQAKGLASQAANTSQVDINALNDQIKAISKQNALDSAALEKSMTPEVSQFRTQSMQNLAGGALNPQLQANSAYLKGQLGQDVGSMAQSPLLQAAIAKARSDLGLGGQLDQDTRNAVVRQGLATAGGVAGGANLGLGRDVSARDLGLTSLQLQQQRLQNAGQFGQAELGMNQFNTQTQFGNAANHLNILQLLNQIQNQGYGQNLASAQFGQSIRPPQVGIDPSSAANIAVSNQNNQGAALANQANIKAAESQNWMNMGGQALGYGLLNYNNAGSGGKMSYDQFISKNPTSNAAVGYQR